MDDYDVIPMFVNPHKSAQHKQAPAFREMTPAEREVLLLLGSEIQAQAGQLLIHENERVSTVNTPLEASRLRNELIEASLSFQQSRHRQGSCSFMRMRG